MPPIGWYLAQGLIPLGYDSSDDDEGPVELPDGRLVCGPHGQVVCYKCCVDYSFIEEVRREEENGNAGGSARRRHPDVTQPVIYDGQFDLDELRIVDEGPPLGFGNEPKKGTGRVFPGKFVPPSTSLKPEELFTGRRAFGATTRLTLPDDKRTGIIYTDGACLENGQANPKAGWAFWHGLGKTGNRLLSSGRLEKKGPFDDEGAQTSNRAELRAVIGALRFRYWPGEGFQKIVFATDSEYVVEGATNWARKWVREGWTRKLSRRGQERVEVKNKDLWLALLGEVEKYKGDGMDVEFWRIPREWNTVADAAAKEAAGGSEDAPEEWLDVIGLAI